MKIKDKILCKKYLNNYAKFYAETWYKIEMIRIIKNISNKNCTIILIRDDNNFSVWFSTDKISNDPYIWKYFYTKQELRKLKLIKLIRPPLYKRIVASIGFFYKVEDFIASCKDLIFI